VVEDRVVRSEVSMDDRKGGVIVTLDKEDVMISSAAILGAREIEEWKMLFVGSFSCWVGCPCSMSFVSSSTTIKSESESMIPRDPMQVTSTVGGEAGEALTRASGLAKRRISDIYHE
jgi:hypothetical protein